MINELRALLCSKESMDLRSECWRLLRSKEIRRGHYVRTTDRNVCRVISVDGTRAKIRQEQLFSHGIDMTVELRLLERVPAPMYRLGQKVWLDRHPFRVSGMVARIFYQERGLLYVIRSANLSHPYTLVTEDMIQVTENGGLVMWESPMTWKDSVRRFIQLIESSEDFRSGCSLRTFHELELSKLGLSHGAARHLLNYCVSRNLILRASSAGRSGGQMTCLIVPQVGD